NLETLLTQAVRSEFIGRGKYEIVPDESGGDALLTGEVLAVTITPQAFTSQQLASRYTIIMTAHCQLLDLGANKVLWVNPSLTSRQDYDAQTGGNVTDPAAFFGQDANALQRMSNDFARTIVSAILEAF